MDERKSALITGSFKTKSVELLKTLLFREVIFYRTADSV